MRDEVTITGDASLACAEVEISARPQSQVIEHCSGGTLCGNRELAIWIPDGVRSEEGLHFTEPTQSPTAAH